MGGGQLRPERPRARGTLAEKSRYPNPDDPDLLWVSQYVDAVLGEGPLYEQLHSVFDADYPPTSLHRLLARLPAILRARGKAQLLVLTTNYDDLIERALEEAGEAFDVVWYEAKPGPLQGRFMHRPPRARSWRSRSRTSTRVSPSRSGRWSSSCTGRSTATTSSATATW